MKFDSSDLTAILRLFHKATDEDSPRQIERIEKSKPHDKNVLITFRFHKKHYALVIDNNAEDDTEYLHEQLGAATDGHRYVLLTNTTSEDELDYGALYKGKHCYLYEDTPLETRLDKAVTAMNPTLTRGMVQKYIEKGYVTIDGEVQTSSKYLVHPDRIVELTIPELDIEAPPVDIIYEDNHVLVINKPVGMLTHAKGQLVSEYTAADVIKSKTEYAADSNRPGIIHRLDRATSGVLVMVKTNEAAKLLSKQFTDRTIKKEYRAVTTAIPVQKHAIIDLPIARNPKKPSTFRVDPNGKTAQTEYSIIEQSDDRALVALKPKTGRTHQLRVHLEYINCPILGDTVYSTTKADRMYLHAHRLECTLPGGNRITFSAPVPEEFYKQIIKT